MRISVCIAAAALATLPVGVSALKWVKHGVPLSGELVLTDVHAIYLNSSNSVMAYATGEGGVLLKLVQAASVAAGTWSTVLDTSFPLYWYGVYSWDANNTLISGFVDGSGGAYGVIQYTHDGGATWSNDTKIDPSVWGGGPIEFAGQEGFMLSTSGSVCWHTSTGGLTWSDWEETTPSDGNWHAGDYLWDGNGYAAIAGSSFCESTDFGGTWTCSASIDASGIDSGVACSDRGSGTNPTALCAVGGGEISPSVAGWLHLSNDGGRTFNATRAGNFPYPVRSVQSIPSNSSNSVVPAVLIAAGGNFFSGVGGIYSSVDGGLTWTMDVDLGQEVKACRALPLPTVGVTRVYCVSAGQSGGSIVSTDIPF